MTDRKKMEIKPCPFCGSQDVDLIQNDIEDREGWPVSIGCMECGASCGFVYTKHNPNTNKEAAFFEALEEWNMRV
jgi:Lar family restriction alleviation protein